MKQMLTKSGTLSAQRRKFLKDTGALAVMTMMGIGFFTSCTRDEDATPDTANGNNTSGNGISINGNMITINLTQATALASTWPIL